MQAYRGLRPQHLQQLERDGVDTTAYVTAQRFRHSLQGDSAAETRARADANFIREKRELLQTLAGFAMKRVGRGLEAARARNVEDTQLNDEVDAKLKMALHGLEGAVTAIRSAGHANYQQDQILRRQYDGLEACGTALCGGAADDAEDTALAAALVPGIGCEAPAAPATAAPAASSASGGASTLRTSDTTTIIGARQRAGCHRSGCRRSGCRRSGHHCPG